jgi:hypothetical protein
MGLLGGGTIVVEKGAGVRDLTIPLPEEGEEDCTGILTDVSNTNGNLLFDTQWQCDCTWLVVTRDF